MRLPFFGRRTFSVAKHEVLRERQGDGSSVCELRRQKNRPLVFMFYSITFAGFAIDVA